MLVLALAACAKDSPPEQPVDQPIPEGGWDEISGIWEGGGSFGERTPRHNYPVRFEIQPTGTYLRTMAAGDPAFDAEGQLRRENGTVKFQDYAAAGTLTYADFKGLRYLHWKGEASDKSGEVNIFARRWQIGFLYDYKPTFPVSAFDERNCMLRADAVAKREVMLMDRFSLGLLFSALLFPYFGGGLVSGTVNSQRAQNLAIETFASEMKACLRARGYAIPADG